MDPSAVTVTVHNIRGRATNLKLRELCKFMYRTTGRLIYMTQQRFDWSGRCDEKLTDPVVSDIPAMQTLRRAAKVVWKIVYYRAIPDKPFQRAEKAEKSPSEGGERQSANLLSWRWWNKRSLLIYLTKLLLYFSTLLQVDEEYV